MTSHVRTSRLHDSGFSFAILDAKGEVIYSWKHHTVSFPPKPSRWAHSWAHIRHPLASCPHCSPSTVFGTLHTSVDSPGTWPPIAATELRFLGKTFAQHRFDPPMFVTRGNMFSLDWPVEVR